MPKPRTHFLIALEPQPAGQTYQALCGQDIPDAYWAMQLDLDYEVIHLFSSIGNCGKCLAKLRETAPYGERRYLYSLISGQQAKNAEEPE